LKNPSSSTLELRALRLALELAAAPDFRISGMALYNHFGAEAALLKTLGLVRPEGQVSTAETRAGDLASVVWSAERGGYGYFSEDEGWVDLSPDEKSVFTLDVQKLAVRLTKDLEVRAAGGFVELVPGILWDLGFARLPQLTKRVSVWVARRLHDPDVFEAVYDRACKRPALDLRLILSLSNAEISGWTLTNQVVASVSSLVSVGDPLKVDAGIASARLRLPVGRTTAAAINADGAHLVVQGRDYRFRGPKQRAIVRLLYRAWKDGKPRLLTQEVLNEADCGRSVRRLASVFKDHPNWHEVIKDEKGMCWLHA
jgi:hypothetical protein